MMNLFVFTLRHPLTVMPGNVALELDTVQAHA
jgi:hypothetical protein